MNLQGGSSCGFYPRRKELSERALLRIVVADAKCGQYTDLSNGNCGTHTSLLAANLDSTVSWMSVHVPYHFSIAPVSRFRMGRARPSIHLHSPSLLRHRYSVLYGSPVLRHCSHCFAEVATSSGWNGNFHPRPCDSSRERPVYSYLKVVSVQPRMRSRLGSIPSLREPVVHTIW